MFPSVLLVAAIHNYLTNVLNWNLNAPSRDSLS